MLAMATGNRAFKLSATLRTGIDSTRPGNPVSIPLRPSFLSKTSIQEGLLRTLWLNLSSRTQEPCPVKMLASYLSTSAG